MKKITRRSFLTVCGAVAAAAALTACGGSASSAAASSTSTAAGSAASSTAAALSGNVATGGSTSMKNVIAALTEGFAEVEPGVTVSYDPTGSGAGITGATDKTLDIGLSSRALKDDEKADVDGTTIALDGIAIIVNNASKVEDLTVDQLKQMFTGEITNWSEVGGDDGEIVLIGREAGSGTRDGFESIVDVKDSCKYAQELRYRRCHQRCGGQPSGHRLRFPVRCGRHREDGHRWRRGVQRGDRQGRQLRGAAPLRVRHQQVCRSV